MIQRLIKAMSSPRLTVIGLLIYAIFLAVATWVERDHGSALTKTFFYHSPLFILLNLLLVVNFLLMLPKYIATKGGAKWYSRLPMLTIHLAFIVILGGATWSHLFSDEGLMHIREGESCDRYYRTEGGYMTDVKLPFTLELTDFRLTRYPGSGSPASYESDLILHDGGKSQTVYVYMNNILKHRGYRFYQSSYDEDELGTILSVSHDSVGTAISYVGYFLLCVGFLLMLLMPQSLFRRTARRLTDIQRQLAATLLLLLVIAPLSAQAQTSKAPSSSQMQVAMQERVTSPDFIPHEVVMEFGKLPVQWQGRIIPLNTLSIQLVQKLTGEKRVGALQPDQFMLSFLAMPEVWMQIPILEVESKALTQSYQLPEGYCAFSDLFNPDGSYRLSTAMTEIYHKPLAKRGKLDKELIKLDEKVNILYSLYEGQLIAPFPDPHDPSHTWYTLAGEREKGTNAETTQCYLNLLTSVRSAAGGDNWEQPLQLLQLFQDLQSQMDKAGLINHRKIEAERWYNVANLFAKCRVGYFIFGGLLLILSFVELTRRQTSFTKRVGLMLTVGIYIVFVVHILGMGLRWYISGYAPWSNSYETMVYVALATVLAGLIFGRRNRLTRSLATLFGGVILFVSGLNWMDPQITTLVPVLRSPWLMFHVAVIVAAYGFFGIGLLLGLANLLFPLLKAPSEERALQMQELALINKLSLLLGLALMTIGTFLGAVWANESWGRYWGWDPKETWALITFVIYAIVTHLHLVKWGRSVWLQSLCSVLAFYSVVMTFFGVNMYLTGMHSYGATEGSSHFSLYLLISFVVIVAIAIPSAIKYHSAPQPPKGGAQKSASPSDSSGLSDSSDSSDKGTIGT